MPHTKSAWKRLRSSETRRKRNRTTVKGIKLQTRKLTDALDGSDTNLAVAEAKATVKKLDKSADRGVIHKNKAARLKSKIAKKLNALAATAAK
ncbi:MAG: 30S ribosomal protein S20 [Fimbriiglobus sp.]